MIYIVYPVMLIILFWGCWIYGRKSWNEEFLSLEQTKALLGFAALCIMFHHIGQKNSASWIDSVDIHINEIVRLAIGAF